MFQHCNIVNLQVLKLSCFTKNVIVKLPQEIIVESPML